MQKGVITNRYMIGGIISGVMMFISGIVGLVFTIIGKVFVARPEDVIVRVNGRVLEGAEAAEKALQIGNILSGVGGVLLIAAAVFLVVCIVLLVVYSAITKEAMG